MLMGEHVRPYRRIPRANSKKDDIAMRERIRLFCRRVSRCKKGAAFDARPHSSYPSFALTKGHDVAAYEHASLLMLIASVVDGWEGGVLICERARSPGDCVDDCRPEARCVNVLDPPGNRVGR